MWEIYWEICGIIFCNNGKVVKNAWEICGIIFWESSGWSLWVCYSSHCINRSTISSICNFWSFCNLRDFEIKYHTLILLLHLSLHWSGVLVELWRAPMASLACLFVYNLLYVFVWFQIPSFLKCSNIGRILFEGVLVRES